MDPTVDSIARWGDQGPRRVVAGVLVAVLAVGALVGLGLALVDGGGDRNSSGSSASSTAEGPAGPAVPDGSTSDAALAAPAPSAASSGAGAPTTPAQTSPAPSDPATVAAGPRVVRTAELSVTLADGAFADAVGQVGTLAGGLGGFVASSTQSGTKDQASATMTVRVPAARYQEALAGLRALGDVQSESQKGDDVSGQLVDLDARLTSQRAQEDALRTLMGQAGTVGEVLAVQDQLFAVRTRIEQLAGQQATLANAADLATITVRLGEPGAVVPSPRPAPSSSTLAEAWERAVGAALGVTAGTLVLLGVLAPLALAAGAAWLVWRATLGRRRPDADATPG